MDTNINNYSDEELFSLLDLEEDSADLNDINTASNNLIYRFQNQNKPELVKFFTDLKNKLISSYEEEEQQQDNVDEWLDNEYLENNDKQQENKVTTRANQVGFFEQDDHVVMDRNRLGINQVGEVPIIQGELNPNLKNTITRIVSLDSQFRENIFPYSENPNSPSSATNYSCLLNDTLTNTLSLELYSVEIPFAWYLIDSYKGNDYFLIQFVDNNNPLDITIKISEGNYSEELLINEINNTIQKVATELNIAFDITFEYIPFSGKTKIKNNTGKQITIIFFNNFNFLSQMKNCENQAKINSNLGWLLGFRGDKDNKMIYVIENNEELISQSMVDVYGPRYFLIVVDDFNQNHINKGLVSITLLNSTTSLPDYYSADLDINCVDDNAVFVQNGPRRLTQAQLYTLNQLTSNEADAPNTRTYAATTTDVFAIIPLKSQNLRPGAPYVEFSGSLQKNKRVYFGPVNIQNFRVRLVDDKGYTVNLHGMDWSFSIISENLYQY